MKGCDYMAITTAEKLASYIKAKYYHKYKREISPLKLQKSLYFCFAYWGGFVRRGNNSEQMTEIDVSEFEEYLFDDAIEAWVYGPVVRSVYSKQNEIKKDLTSPFNNDFITQFIDGILDDILSISDFALVEESHKDNCWKNNFDFNEMIHSNEIPKEDIIKEYVYK